MTEKEKAEEVVNQWSDTKKLFWIVNEWKKCAKFNGLEEVKCKNKINQKETEKGRKRCDYTEYVNSRLQSGAEILNPSDCQGLGIGLPLDDW